MSTLIRRPRHAGPLVMTLVTMLVALLTAGVGSAPALAHSPATVVDGIGFDHLPAALGGSTDFTYAYDDVDFVSRDWESRFGAGWRIDLDLTVMRGSRLRSGRALHDWFIPYEERPPAEARYRFVRIHGRPGWVCRDEVFWLVRPGLAVSVLLDRHRWPVAEVLRVARSASELA